MGGGGKSRKRQRKESSSSSAAAAATAATTVMDETLPSFAWKKVNVHLDPQASTEAAGDDDDAADWHDNHYDNTDNNDDEDVNTEKHGGGNNKKLAKRANLDLPGNQHEEMGMFYGLEVMDGHAYTAEKRPDGSVYFCLNNNNNKNDTKSGATTTTTRTTTATPTSETALAETKKKKSKKARKEEQAREKKQASVMAATPPIEASTEASPKEASTEAALTDEPPAPTNPTKKKKPEKKKDKKKKPSLKQSQQQQHDKKPKETSDDQDEDAAAAVAQQQQQEAEQELTRMQSCWTTQTAGVEFHLAICQYFVQNAFWTPTPIQAATLPAAVLGRCNIVGAAPTGSGKTLAFLLPILQSLLVVSNPDLIQDEKCNLQALILTPTRELALQISTVCQSLFAATGRARNSTVTLVGGLAHAKQIRILNAKPKPLVCVATPGRLWELISSRDHEHLNDLSQLKFLVMDEADRMVQQASFPQLIHILDAVHQANPMQDDESDNADDENGEEDDDDDDDEQNGLGRMLGLPGIPGEAKVEMLNNDILKRLKRQQKRSTSKAQDNDGNEDDSSDGSGTRSNDDDDDDSCGNIDDVIMPQVNEMEDEEFEQQMKAVAEYNPNDDDQDKIALPLRPPVHRQTFIYSATLTLPSSTSNVQSIRRNNKGNNSRRGGKGGGPGHNVDGAIAEILEKANAKGKTKVVDLTNMDRGGGGKHTKSVVVTGKNEKDTTTTSSTAATKSAKTTTTGIKTVSSPSFRLPPGLELQQIKCTQRHKDSHLYGYLMTTRQGLSSGPCLVFCNSIAGVRRVGATLQALGLHDVRILHAQMQQRARFKAVELLGRSNARTVVVATDVAARGLDIPSVASVVHYDAARSVDSFVHRSGRTARGVGPRAVGCSLSLVAPGEDKMHNSIVAALGVRFEDVLMDGRLLKEAQERTNLATKVVLANDLERKNKERSQWFQKQADEAGLEMDEDILQEGEITDRRDQNLLRDAKSARRRLEALLAQPMTTQRYGKFLSTNSAARQDVVISSSSAAAVLGATGKKRRRRR